jgi:hypothetical protein
MYVLYDGVMLVGSIYGFICMGINVEIWPSGSMELIYSGNEKAPTVT